MNYSLAFLFFIFIIHSGNLQILRKCDGVIECIDADQCPSVEQLRKSRSRADLLKFRNIICGYRRRTVLVCCPSEIPENNAPKGSSLLPETCGRPVILNMIFGGSPSPIGAYPWLAALAYTRPGEEGFIFDCGGSIINYRYVLTAAHCVHRSNLGRRRLVAVHLGVRDITKAKDCIKIAGEVECFKHVVAGPEEIIIHPDYNRRGVSSDDIALIRLNVSLNFEDPSVLIEPVCLPKSSDLAISVLSHLKPKAIAAGWGLTEHKNTSKVVLSTRVPLRNVNQCIDIFGSQFVGKQLCVGGEKGIDSCKGDSGGPLVIPLHSEPPYTQIGIVSFGTQPCGIVGFPSVYTSVGEYTQWITDNIKP